MRDPKISRYRLSCHSLKQTIRIVVIADFHDSSRSPFNVIDGKITPDFIVIPGDLLYAGGKNHSIYDCVPDSGQHLINAKNAVSCLKEAVKIAPVIFSTGNHELYLDCDDRALLSALGVHFLDNNSQRFGDIVFGGLSSPYNCLSGTGNVHTKAEHKSRWEMVFKNVNTGWLDEFEKKDGFKILLCHHPEFYEPFLKSRNGIDLIFSGHAHGGQIRLFGRGLYAYGQGLFPKYTKGIYDGKLIVSAGLANTSRIPRIGNPTELVYIELSPQNQSTQ